MKIRLHKNLFDAFLKKSQLFDLLYRFVLAITIVIISIQLFLQGGEKTLEEYVTTTINSLLNIIITISTSTITLYLIIIVCIIKDIIYHFSLPIQKCKFLKFPFDIILRVAYDITLWILISLLALLTPIILVIFTILIDGSLCNSYNELKELSLLSFKVVVIPLIIIFINSFVRDSSPVLLKYKLICDIRKNIWKRLIILSIYLTLLTVIHVNFR